MRLPNTERAFKSWQRQQKALLDKLGEPGTSHKHNMALLKALEASDRAFGVLFTWIPKTLINGTLLSM